MKISEHTTVEICRASSKSRPKQDSLQNSAVQYSQNGWKVLPCIPTGPRSKAPLIRRSFEAASSDPTIAAYWWESFPDALIGLAVPLGTVVLDIDPRDGGSCEQLEALAEGQLPKTLVAESGRGDGGRHYWFSTTARGLKHAGLPRGIDLREGGKSYVIAPPSLHPLTGKPYRWVNYAPIAELPASLLSVLKPQKEMGARAFASNSSSHPALTRIMSEATEGERNEKLFWCACRLAELELSGVRVSWDALFEAAFQAGLNITEVDRTVQSAIRTVREGKSQK